MSNIKFFVLSNNGVIFGGDDYTKTAFTKEQIKQEILQGVDEFLIDNDKTVDFDTLFDLMVNGGQWNEKVHIYNESIVADDDEDYIEMCVVEIK